MNPQEEEEGSPLTPLWWQRSILSFSLYRNRYSVAGAASFLLLLLLGGALNLSLLRVERGLTVFASDPTLWWAGAPLALRVEARSLETGTLLELRDVRVSWHRVGGARVSDALSMLEERIEDRLQGNLSAPPVPGRWRLQVEAESDEGTLRVSRAVELQKTPPERALPPLADRPYRTRAPTGRDQLHLFPSEQGLVYGGQSELYLRLLSPEGQPKQGVTLYLIAQEGESETPAPPTLVTDKWGLAAFPWRTRWPLTSLSYRSDHAEVFEAIRTSTARFQLTPRNHFISPASPLELSLSSQEQRAKAYLDLWWRGVWLRTGTGQLWGGAGRAQLMIPPLPAAVHSAGEGELFWVQSYHSPYLPGAARGGSWLLSSDDRSAAARWLREQLITAEQEADYLRHLPEDALTAQRPLRHILGRLAKPPGDPQIICDSGESAKESLTLLKDRWLGRLVGAFSLSGLLLAGLIILLIFRQRKQLIEDWVEAGGEASAGAPYAAIQIGAMLFILALFFGGMSYLVMLLA